MLIIERKDDDAIRRMLKRFKRKHRHIALIKELRSRKHFEKQSVKRRKEILNVEYRAKKFDDN